MRLLLNGDEREQPSLQIARREATGTEAIAKNVADEFGEPWKDIKSRRGHPSRALAIVLYRRHTSLKLSEIGERLGGSDYAAVAQAQNRMERNTARIVMTISYRVCRTCLWLGIVLADLCSCGPDLLERVDKPITLTEARRRKDSFPFPESAHNIYCGGVQKYTGIRVYCQI